MDPGDPDRGPQRTVRCVSRRPAEPHGARMILPMSTTALPLSSLRSGVCMRPLATLLLLVTLFTGAGVHAATPAAAARQPEIRTGDVERFFQQIGRASCRERVCQYV